MLARGVICRLAADAPKTSTHDLPRLSNLLQSSLLSRNALSLPAARALSRAYRAVLSEYRRSYATSAGATKPTTRVKKDVKQAAAKKPLKAAGPTKKTAKKTARKPAKKPAAKKSAAKKAKPKKKVAAKPKPKPKKVLTPEEKTRAEIRDLKLKALRIPVTQTPSSAWTVFAAEALAGQTGIGVAKTKLKDAGAKFKELTPAEKEASHGL
jgi:outer membrane biosynthesis protein TonB